MKVTVFMAASLVAAGLTMVALGLARRAGDRRRSLAALLEVEMAEPGSDPQRLARLWAKAGAAADRALSRTTWSERYRLMLTQTGWSVKPGEFAAMGAAGAVTAAVGVALVSGSAVAGVVAAFVCGLGTVWLLDAWGKRRVRKVEEQLPTVLQLLAGSLESGSSVLHALEIVVEEGQPPLATEFARVVAETRVGRPLLEAMEAMAARVGSRDLDWTVEAIRIQHTTGGRLADTLRVLAEFMRARLEIRGEVRALSAEARLSAHVLTALPLLVGGFFVMFRSAYIAPLFSTSAGRMMLVVAAAGMALGTVWMRRIVRVEV